MAVPAVPVPNPQHISHSSWMCVHLNPLCQDMSVTPQECLALCGAIQLLKFLAEIVVLFIRLRDGCEIVRKFDPRSNVALCADIT